MVASRCWAVTLSAASKTDVVSFDGERLRAIYGPRWRLLSLTDLGESLRVVMAQLNLRVGDVHGNVERIIESACSARDQWQADVIVFPELALCGYPPEDLLLRSSMQLRIEQALQRLQDEVRGIYMVVGYPWLEDELRYNACAVIADGQLLAL